MLLIINSTICICDIYQGICSLVLFAALVGMVIVGALGPGLQDY